MNNFKLGTRKVKLQLFCIGHTVTVIFYIDPCSPERKQYGYLIKRRLSRFRRLGGRIHGLFVWRDV